MILTSSIKLRSLKDISPLQKITFPILGREIRQLDRSLPYLGNENMVEYLVPDTVLVCKVFLKPLVLYLTVYL